MWSPEESYTEVIVQGMLISNSVQEVLPPQPSLSLTELSTSEGTFREHLCFQGLIRTLPIYFILCVMQ